MKKSIISLGLIFCLGLSTKAQYFQHYYPTATSGGTGFYELCSAVCTSQGITMPVDQYIMGSYKAVNTGNYNFEIRKVDEAGLYTIGGAPYFHISFFDGYNVFKAASPGGSPSNLMSNTYGISVIETGPAVSTPGPNYAVTGAVSDPSTGNAGCFFLRLNVDGAVISTDYYEFPRGARNISKPLIVEDLPNNPGRYFICGSYWDPGTTLTVMYVLYVVPGGLTWSANYDSGEELVPTGLLVSPHNTQELVITGRNYPFQSVYPGSNEEGFFVKLDLTNNGSVIPGSFTIYGDGNNQYFTSLAPAFNPFPSAADFGFVVGGISDPVGGFGNSWMLKLDQMGNILWTEMITGSNGANTEITGVLERFGPSGCQYYGSTSTGQLEMDVFKLNDAGQLWTGTTPVYNEFSYTATGGGPAYIASASGVAGYGDGIEVFGTDILMTGTYDTYMVKAYYNGWNGNCGIENISDISGQQGPGPNTINYPTINQTFGLKRYTFTDFFVKDFLFVNNLSLNAFCPSTSDPNGNNSRMISSGISQQSSQSAETSVFPNPASSNLTIRLTDDYGGLMNIRIFNTLGECVQQTEKDLAKGTAAVELNVADLSAGYYTVSYSHNGATHQAKIVIEH